MKKLLKKDFLNMVMKEINRIKKEATKEEIGELNFNTLNPYLSITCIYGQMTGSCTSARAKILHPKTFKETADKRWTFNDWVKSKDSELGCMVTPLEVYITLKDSKNKKVIQYLKGEIKELKL
jgi:hypothetical protein